MKQLTFIKETIQIKRFNPRKRGHDYSTVSSWYVDLPEYLEAGLGTKANLAMVAGADTFLDLLLRPGEDRVVINLDTNPFNGYDARLMFKGQGMDPEVLKEYNHPEVDFGGYYDVKEYEGKPFYHELWLCPVALYVFDGVYPREIFIAKVNQTQAKIA